MLSGQAPEDRVSRQQLNIQDLFLNQLRRESIPVTLYLSSGVQLRGLIRAFDAFTVALEGQGKPPQLVYKHSIISVAPQRHPSIRFGPPEQEEPSIQVLTPDEAESVEA